MQTLDDHIEPGERVVWRTASLRGEAMKTLVWVAVVAAFAAAGAIWIDEGFPFLIAAVLAVVLFDQWGRRPAEAWITDRRILFLRGVVVPRIAVVDRKDVTRVELYVGDDTLVLQGAGGELYRAAILEAPDGLLEEIGLPIAVWRDRVPSHLFNFSLLAFVFVLIATAFIVLAVTIGVIFLGVKDTVRTALGDALPLAVLWPGILWTVLMAIAILLGTIIGLAGTALLRRIMLTSDELASFRRAVRHPVWGGNDPQSPLYARGFYRLYRAARLTLDRLLYGRPPDRGIVEPETVAPGSLDEFRA